MYFDHYLGIDISKATLDAALIIKEGEVVGQTKVANNSHGFNDLASWIRKLKVKLSDVLVCAEHTGIYGYDLQIWLDDMQISFAFVSALEIKRSLGIRRGKNDAVDALRIAEYAYIRRESISLSQAIGCNLPAEGTTRRTKTVCSHACCAFGKERCSPPIRIQGIH